MDKEGADLGAPRRWPLLVTLIVGLGLIVAPLVFQMFSRAPEGGTMIDGFKPYMRPAVITRFQGDMRTIGAAVTEARSSLGPASASSPSGYAELLARWDGIDSDMSSMLSTMQKDIGDFNAVAALPPFPLFPWFFVAPGVLLVGVSVWALVRQSRRRGVGGALLALAILGLGLIAAPAMFQMWSRAPKGGQMISDFVPIMTQAKVTTVQGYFLTLGDGEAALRTQMVPAWTTAHHSTAAGAAATLPAVHTFSAEWPGIEAQMAPMIGAMSDNLGNYAAVRALPPFPLFPWFFAIPGLLVTLSAGAGYLLNRRRPLPALPVPEARSAGQIPATKETP